MPVENAAWPPEGAPDGTHSPAAAAVTESAHYGPPSIDEGPVLEPHRGGDVDENPRAGSKSVAEEPEVFDPRVREDFEGLLFLGRLTESFSWAGHRFEIRTLVTDEALDVALVTRMYRDSYGEVKAYQAAVVGACVVSVDGRPLPVPLTNDPLDTGVKNRFEYVKRSWFPPTLDAVYEQFLLLEGRVQAAIEAMGKASR